MKVFFQKSILLIGFIFSICWAQDVIPDEFIIQLDEEMDVRTFLSKQENAAFRFKRTLSRHMNIHLLGVADFSSPKRLLGRLRKMQGLAKAQFNHEVERREEMATIPQDSLFPGQWALNNIGQSGGLIDADIDATEAWDLSKGGTSKLGDKLVVAVIDDGFFLNHDDMYFWENTGEIPNNGFDDDQNGYIDDYHGWNAIDQNGLIQTQFHGTGVAGVIGAIADNPQGVAGVAWKTAVMPVVGLSASEATVIEAYEYILTQRLLYESSHGEKGAFVIATNASFGVNRGNPADFPIWCGIYDFMGQAGILNVAATANSSFNVDQAGDIPTACTSDYLITVTSSDIQDQKAGGSAFGPISIDMAAPGTAILTTLVNNNFGTVSGTSYAAPFAAGTIALLMAAYCPPMMADYLNDPASYTLMLKDLLLESTDSLASLNNLVRTSGRLNAFKAVSALVGSCAGLASDCTTPFRMKAASLTETQGEFAWQRYQDSIRAKLRYRIQGTSNWEDSLIVSGTDTLISGLMACATYEWQLASSCSNWSVYTPIQVYRTPGCCEAPTTMFFQKTDSSLLASWSEQLGVNYYSVQYRPVGATVWQGDTTLDTTFLAENLMGCTDYEWRVWSVCDRAPLDTLVSVATTQGCGSCTDLVFCEARGTDVSIEWVDSLSIGSIQLRSGRNGGYGDFTSQNYFLFVDSLYEIYLGPGYNGGTFTEKWRVWLDLNFNGVFDSTELLVDPEAQQGAIRDSLIIPAGTAEGSVRMRVAMRWAGFDRLTVPEACGVYTEGEVEDFCVVLKTGSDVYCEASSEGVGAEWIDEVQIDSVNTASGLADSGYQFFPTPIFVSKGADIELRLIPTSLLPQPGFWRIWGDWNQDGFFAESELWVDTFQSELDTLSLQQRLPLNAHLGKVRLRIALRRDSLPEACGTFRFGEVEDYVLNISEPNSMEEEINLFKVFPNPSSTVWNIESAPVGQTGMLRLFDLSGKLISEKNLVQGKASLRADGLEKGIYLLNITINGRESWKKLLKQ